MLLLLTACVTQDEAKTDGSASGGDADGDGVSSPRDCDDSDPDIRPGVHDICDDGVDQDCDGRDARCDVQDDDNDGFTVADGDCDDTDFNRNPDKREICEDGVDQDCSGADLDCADADQDGDGFSPNEGDCDDEDIVITPGRLETCDDGIDQDCDGRDLPCAEVDQDGDNYSRADGDCDDTSLRIHPGAPETCGNNQDEDCDGMDAACVDNDRDDDGVPDDEDLCPDTSDPQQADREGDGVGDFCDNCPAVRNADQADSDGDGDGDACDGDVDQDGDGVLGREGDCDDSDPEVFPGAEEVCNGTDDDCSGFVDDGCPADIRSQLVAIPAGPSLLGSLDADPAGCARDPRSDENCDEVPQREVQLSAFAVEPHEVTNAQYQACLQAGRCTGPARPMGVASAQQFGDPAFADHPVVWVTRVQASSYCAWAGRRLPTEAEWERVARGDAPVAQRRYPWGDAAPDCERANVANCNQGTRPVGSFAGDRTAQGVSDLGGNVLEMTAGYYNATYYRDAPAQDPPGAQEPDERRQIPVRGGSHRSAPAFSTLTYRGFRHLVGDRDARPDVGFRCVQ